MKNSVISEKEIDYIVDIILSEEGLKDNKEFNILVTDRMQFYKDLFSMKKNKFSDNLLLPFLANGANNMKNDILLFADNITKNCDKDHAVYRFVEVIYHEIRHVKQLSFDKYSYEKLFDEVDKYLRIYKNYYFNHDNYYFEIDASGYSMYKTEIFLKKYYPNVYEKYKTNIEKRKEIYNNDMFLFDSVNKLSDFIGLYRYNKYRFKNDKSLNQISPVFDIFLDKKMNYRNISEIVTNEKFKELDKRIVYSFFSVDSFLDRIDFSSLSNDDLSIIMESLMYTKDLYKKQLIKIDKYFDDKKNSVIDYLKRQKSLIKRIDYIYNFINRNFFSSIYFIGNSINKKRLIKSIDKVIVE